MKYQLSENNIFTYIKKLSKKWWVLLAFIPSVFGLFKFYFGLPEIILSWKFSLILFSILLIIANYLVWYEEYKKNQELQIKIKEYEDKKPKLNLTFVEGKKNFILKNKVFERVLDESPGIKIIDNPNIIKRMTEKILGLEDSPVIDEISESFVPLKFELHNEGEFVATDVSVDIEFPEGLVLIEDLPKENNFLPSINMAYNKTLGISFQKKNKLKLWCNKLQPPYFLDFRELYIFSDKIKKFRIKYQIHSDELGFKGINGELIIDAHPSKEIRKYTIKSELEKDKREYEEILNNQMKESI